MLAAKAGQGRGLGRAARAETGEGLAFVESFVGTKSSARAAPAASATSRGSRAAAVRRPYAAGGLA